MSKPKTLTAEADSVSVKAKTATVDAQTNDCQRQGQPCRRRSAPVARLGDTVEVDPNTHKGTITAGSTEVTAG